MKARCSMLVLFVLLTVQVAFAQAPGAEFDAYVNKALKDWGVPGVAIAIVKDDKIVFAKGFGVRELNKQLRSGYKGSYSFREKIDIEGLNHPKRMFDLTEGLIRHKYSDSEIEGILGGNFERVLTQIWT